VTVNRPQTRVGIVLLAALCLLLSSDPAGAATAACAAPTAQAGQAAAPIITSPPVVQSVGSSTAFVSAAVDAQGQPATYYIAYGTTVAYSSCTTPAPVPAGAGPQSVQAQLMGLAPATTYHFELIVESSAGSSTGADEAFATPNAPAKTVTSTIARKKLAPRASKIAGGVKVGPILVGGLTKAAALKRLSLFLAHPLRFSFHGARWAVPGTKLGGQIDGNQAVEAALAASANDRVSLRVRVAAGAIQQYLATLNSRFGRPEQRGNVRFDGGRAVVTPNTGARRLNVPRMATLIRTELLTGNRTLLGLATETTPPPPGTGAKAVVIKLDTQTLTAYLNGNAVLTTPVTTGRPALPTPTGSFYIHFGASPYTFISPWPRGNPYWYPPTPVTWAMYFTNNDFLHDDPGEPARARAPSDQVHHRAERGARRRRSAAVMLPAIELSPYRFQKLRAQLGA